MLRDKRCARYYYAMPMLIALLRQLLFRRYVDMRHYYCRSLLMPLRYFCVACLRALLYATPVCHAYTLRYYYVYYCR